jgi:imidazole glycerol-phosphate synthase subunit HisH
MIALLDYGSGNLRSVEKALLKVGADVRVTADPAGMRGAGAVVLPGVGAFDDCINALRRQELLGAVREFIRSGKPFLGICVGYQALFERSEEFNSCAAGLEIFKGRVVRFSGAGGLKVPQIGWNQVRVAQPDCRLFQGVAPDSYFYFVHSYFPQPVDPAIVAGQTDYGETCASAITWQNVFRDPVPPREKPEGRTAVAEEFCGSRGLS